MFAYSEEAIDYEVDGRPAPQRSKPPQRYSPRFDRRGKKSSKQRSRSQSRCLKRSAS